ncbi:MAG TPA: hypothetical protein PKK10_02560 [Woeseiaceae bacterium]|nr:hypothetical protein [Woeseiaceae bacterium]
MATINSGTNVADLRFRNLEVALPCRQIAPDLVLFIIGFSAVPAVYNQSYGLTIYVFLAKNQLFAARAK